MYYSSGPDIIVQNCLNSCEAIPIIITIGSPIQLYYLKVCDTNLCNSDQFVSPTTTTIKTTTQSTTSYSTLVTSTASNLTSWRIFSIALVLLFSLLYF